MLESVEALRNSTDRNIGTDTLRNSTDRGTLRIGERFMSKGKEEMSIRKYTEIGRFLSE
jgi:hypothetical protein